MSESMCTHLQLICSSGECGIIPPCRGDQGECRAASRKVADNVDPHARRGAESAACVVRWINIIYLSDTYIKDVTKPKRQRSGEDLDGVLRNNPLAGV